MALNDEEKIICVKSRSGEQCGQAAESSEAAVSNRYYFIVIQVPFPDTLMKDTSRVTHSSNKQCGQIAKSSEGAVSNRCDLVA